PSRSILVRADGTTLAICAPEQAEGQPVSRKTDTWSWGVSVLAMFTGGVTWSAGCMAPGVLQQYLKETWSAERSPLGAPRAPLPMPGALGDLLLDCFRSPAESRPN